MVKDTTSAKRARARTDDEKSYHFVTFMLGGELHAVRIEHVKEVAMTPPISKMPKTPSFIRGVTNIRGDLIAIVDLEERFELRSALKLSKNNYSQSYTIVIEADTYSIGFLVKEMPNTLVLTESQIDRSADVVEKARIRNRFIIGLGKSGEGKLVILLDILKVLSEKEIRQLSK